MSHRRKHVSQALLQDASPEVLAGQRILRVCEHRGSNILEVRVCVSLGLPVRSPLLTVSPTSAPPRVH